MTTRFPTTYHTAGTTYSRAGMYALPAGDWSAAATVKTAGGTLVQALAVNLSELGSPDVDGNTHALSVLATAVETATWPLQQLLCDIIFTDASVTPVKVPAVTVAINVSAHTVPLSDADNPLQTISGDMAPVLRGETGPAGADSTVPGPAGATGAAGADGQGVPTGGTTGQVLAKASDDDHDTEWVAQTGGGGSTNLAYTASPTGGTVTSDTGTDATIPLADGTNAGLMTPAQKATLDATSGANTGDQDLSGYSLTSHNHAGVYDPAGTASSAVSTHVGLADPHTQYALESALGTAAAASTTDFAPAAHVGAGGSAHANAIAAGAAGFMSGADKTKLDGIASGADVTDIAADTHAATSKTTPVDADELPLVDSAASNVLKKLTWANIKATLTTLFDAAYLKLTGGTLAGGTVTTSSPVLTTTQTWNNAGVKFVAKSNDITNTASASNSVLERWQVDGVDLITFIMQYGVIEIKNGNGNLAIFSSPVNIAAQYGAYGPRLRASANIEWSASSTIGSTSLSLYCDAAGTLAQRNGTNAQTNRLYGTYTDASNYRRVQLSMTTAGVAELKPEGAGSGASGNVLHISGLPTSNPGPGILWNNAGSVAIGT